MIVTTQTISNKTLTPKPEWLKSYSRVAIIGLGVTGFSVLEYLSQFDLDIFVVDSRDEPSLIAKAKAQTKKAHADIQFYSGGFSDVGLSTMDLLVVSPGVPLAEPEIQQAIVDGVEICGDIDLVGRATDLPIIAITGSNGKSTVTTLVGEICKAAGFTPFVGGNLGVPALYLLANRQDYDVVVLELSSFQLETTHNLKLIASIILNLSADHMDRYASFDDYVQAKSSIHLNSKYCVYNRDDELTKQGIHTISDSTSFGLGNGNKTNGYGVLDGYIVKGNQKLMPISEMKMIGQHNIANALAALVLVESLNIDFSLSKKVLESFSGLSHRTELVAEINTNRWVNDSKATNVGACQAALEGIDGNIILIAGGQGKDGEFSEMLDVLKAKVKHVLLFGEDAEKIHAVWSRATNCHLVTNMEEAVKSASLLAKKNDTILLSPACASLDMYSSYGARGEHFIRLVGEFAADQGVSL